MKASLNKVVKIVLEVSKPERIDKTLVRMIPQEIGLSRSQIKSLMASGRVSDESKNLLTDPSQKSLNGQEVTVEIPALKLSSVQAENIELDIRYEDSDLLVVNKLAGMVVHPAPGNESGTLVNALLYHCKDSLSGIGGIMRPGIVHRIDKDTSGLIVVAKTDKVHAGLAKQFYNHTIDRRYIALVHGNPWKSRKILCNKIDGVIIKDDNKIKVSRRIARHSIDRKKMAAYPDKGRTAVTNLLLKKSYGFESCSTISVLECRLETGRTHQIRVHLDYLGNNIIGDKVYGLKKKTKFATSQKFGPLLNRFPRQALHAKTLSFTHPRSGERISLEADVPKDIKELLSQLDEMEQSKVR
ncbi:MAG: RluA family pseudouridine synthase [Pseudomonadota bacterium]|nr:RluA family pseudouridine synthase [Pseudomonadota bacterium]